MSLISPSCSSYTSLSTTGHYTRTLFGGSTKHSDSPQFKGLFSEVNIGDVIVWRSKETPSSGRPIRVKGIGRPARWAKEADHDQDFLKDLNLVGTEWKNYGELAYHIASHSPNKPYEYGLTRTTERRHNLFMIARGEELRILSKYGIEFQEEGAPSYSSGGISTKGGGWDINKRDSKEYTLLHRLLMAGGNALDALSLLEINDKVDLKAKMPNGCTPFEYLWERELDNRHKDYQEGRTRTL